MGSVVQCSVCSNSDGYEPKVTVSDRQEKFKDLDKH